MKCVSDNINNPIKQEEFIMKNLKKTLAAIAALTMVTASMSGCGSSEDKSSGSTASSSGESVSSSSVSEESNGEMSNEERIISQLRKEKSVTGDLEMNMKSLLCSQSTVRIRHIFLSHLIWTDLTTVQLLLLQP